MSKRMPVVFVSHGAPDSLTSAPDTVACWRDIAEHNEKPLAILAVSAHWEASRPALSLSRLPETIHDFSGFSPALYRIRYPAPGNPSLAEKCHAMLLAAGIASDLHPDRGLDHGTWVPLSIMYPKADIPVVQLALVQGGTPLEHLHIGQALAGLRDEGVLILASGAITHNFSWLSQNPENIHRSKAVEFSDWLGLHLIEQEQILEYRRAAFGAQAHPSEEHILPLFVALGAAGNEKPVRYQPEFTYSALSMDAYLWP